MTRAGDDESFAEAFDALFRRAMRLAHRILGDRDTAEDVAAEAMARAYARWSKLKDKTWREGWVLRVTTNLAIDVARRKKPEVPPAAEPRMEDDVAIRVTLVAALRALSTRQREAIVLRYLSGLDEAEVAAALGISAGSVKTHIHRGMTTLRSRLGDEVEEVALASD